MTAGLLRMARVTWSEPELKGLVEFVLFHSNGEHYPQHKRDDYWAASAADVVQKQKCIGPAK